MIAKIWKNRIVAGDQIYSECPKMFKEAVKTLLEKDVENGVLTEEAYKELINA